MPRACKLSSDFHIHNIVCVHDPTLNIPDTECCALGRDKSLELLQDISMHLADPKG